VKFPFTLDDTITGKIKMTSRGDLKLRGKTQTNWGLMYLTVLCNVVGGGGRREHAEK
jgi:hypothetical protein